MAVPRVCSYQLPLDVVLLGYRSYRDFFAVDIYTELLGRPLASADYLIADWPGPHAVGVQDGSTALGLLTVTSRWYLGLFLHPESSLAAEQQVGLGNLHLHACTLTF